MASRVPTLQERALLPRPRAAGRAAHLAATLCAAAALLLAGMSLWDTLAAPGDAGRPVERAAAPDAPGPGAGGPGPEAGRDRPWPALFGVPDPAPQPVAPPPSLPVDYVLKGLVTSGGTRWAILAGDGEDRLVREGDVLGGGVEVAEIRPQGVWVAFEGVRELIAFSDTEPVRVASVEVASGDGDAAAPRARQDVQTQSLTPAELRDIILRAEAARLASGRVPAPDGGAETETGPGGDRRVRSPAGLVAE